MTTRHTRLALVVLLTVVLGIIAVLATPRADAQAKPKATTRFEILFIKQDFKPNQKWIATKLYRNGKPWAFHPVHVLCKWEGKWHEGGSDYTDDLGRVHWIAYKHGTQMPCKVVSDATATTQRAETRTFQVGVK